MDKNKGVRKGVERHLLILAALIALSLVVMRFESTSHALATAVVASHLLHLIESAAGKE